MATRVRDDSGYKRVLAAAYCADGLLGIDVAGPRIQEAGFGHAGGSLPRLRNAWPQHQTP